MEKLTQLELSKLNSSKGLFALLSDDSVDTERAIRYIDYERKLKKLQTEFVRMQKWVLENNKRLIVIFEGRDAAGKGGAIRRITERINPRHIKILALPKPTEDEQSQWYFQRYVNQLPKAGEMIFFNRSWYNRAVVEPVMGFCTNEEYLRFMNQVNDVERMILESGIYLVKIYMSISKKEQAKRFDDIKNDPLKQWKITPVDLKAQELWDQYTHYKDEMFRRTNTVVAPWKVIKANRKTEARINAMKYILKRIPYDTKLPI